MQTPHNNDWAWALKALAKDNQRAGCHLNVADTVILRAVPQTGKKKNKKNKANAPAKRVPVLWAFTNKHGEVTRHKLGRGSAAWGRIAQRFCKVASKAESDPNAAASVNVCMMQMDGGSTLALDQIAFRALVAGAQRDNGLTAVEALQVWATCFLTVPRTRATLNETARMYEELCNKVVANWFANH
jgi:hypothetical protein